MIFFIESRAKKERTNKNVRCIKIRLDQAKHGEGVYDKSGHVALSEVMILSRVSLHPVGSLL